jgi:MFS family permease
MMVPASDDGDSQLTGSIAAATWALFAGLMLLLTGAGLIGSLLGVRAELEGFSTLVSGVISASYYAGFLVGSKLAYAALSRVGHIRVYTALASLTAAAILVQGLAPNPVTWTAMRFVTGLCIAGQYVVAESWLNDLATNDNRGKLLAVYNIVVSAAFGLGQVVLGFGNAATLTLFAVASILTTLAVVPVALSEASAPSFQTPGQISLKELAAIVPSGFFAALIVGVTHGGMFGMAAVFATKVGLSSGGLTVFLTAPLVGGILFQLPISSASDDVDRRAVTFFVSIAAGLVAVLLALTSATGWKASVLMMALGGLTYPLYSLAAAYTNDWAPPDKLMAVASQLILVYGAGALVGPLLVSATMSIVGNQGYFWWLAFMHGCLAAFMLYRLFAWRRPLIYGPWSAVSIPARAFYVPATMISITKRLRSRRAMR